MSRSKELPTATLEMINPCGRSLRVERQRQVVFGRMYGPAGIEFCRGIRDGSLTSSDLPRFSRGRDGIDRHFFQTVQRAYCNFGNSKPEELYTGLQEIGIRVVRRLVARAFPHQGSRLWQLKNEVLFKAPSPKTIFKILALPDDQVDKKAAFQAERQLLIMHTGAPLLVRSRGYHVGQRLADLNDIFDEEVFEGPYAAGEEYRLQVYHDDQTNEVIRFHTGDKDPKPPKQGERLATHHFTARRVKGYGLVFVDVSEEDVIDATIRALAKAAHNGGVINPTTDVKGGMKMTFVDLEEKPEYCKDGLSNMPHLTALKRIVMEVMLRHSDIKSMDILSNAAQGYPDNSKVDIIELFQRGLLDSIPIRLEFFSRKDFLNSRYHVGIRGLVNGIPGSMYDGQAQELSELRSYYRLVPHLFPKEVFGIDPQEVLLETIDEKATQLKQACTDQVTYLSSDEIQSIINQAAV